MKEHLFGVFPCLAALRADRRIIYRIIVKDDLQAKTNLSKPDKIHSLVHTAKEKGLKIQYKPKAVLDKLVGNRPHQNIIMTVSPLKYEKMDSFDKFYRCTQSTGIEKGANLWIALDQVQDPMNLGAILRSAAYFGIKGVIVSAKNSCHLSPTVSKASAGAMEWMIIYGTNDLSACLNSLASDGWDIIGSTMPVDDCKSSDVIPCQKLILDKPTVLVLGNEGTGIRDEVLKCCTTLTTIQGSLNRRNEDLDSLNVSVASGILIHSLVQRQCLNE